MLRYKVLSRAARVVLQRECLWVGDAHTTQRVTVSLHPHEAAWGCKAHTRCVDAFNAAPYLQTVVVCFASQHCRHLLLPCLQRL